MTVRYSSTILSLLSGLRLQPLQDHLMAKPLEVNLTMYYLMSMYKPPTVIPESSTTNCFKGSPSSHSPVGSSSNCHFTLPCWCDSRLRAIQWLDNTSIQSALHTYNTLHTLIKSIIKNSRTFLVQVLWTQVKSLDAAYARLSSWKTVLATGGCSEFSTSSRLMFYQALLRSFTGLIEVRAC